MEDTCKQEKCWLYRLMKELLSEGEKLEVSDCPFYLEMVFTPDPVDGKVQSAKLIKDCANKRDLLFTLEQIYPRMMGVQVSQEEMRNQSSQATTVFTNLLKKAYEHKESLDVPKPHDLIELEDKNSES